VRKDLAAYELGTRRASRRDGAQLLIPRSDGEPWREHDYRNWRRRVFKPAVAAAGLPITRPYDLRHAAASLMIHAGKPLTEIAEHLGNSVAVLSTTYAHVIKDMRGQPTTSVPDAIMSARTSRRSRSASSVSRISIHRRAVTGGVLGARALSHGGLSRSFQIADCAWECPLGSRRLARVALVMKGSPVRVRASAPLRNLCICRGFCVSGGALGEGVTPDSGGVLGAVDAPATCRRPSLRAVRWPASASRTRGRRTASVEPSGCLICPSAAARAGARGADLDALLRRVSAIRTA
jgi:hypothetical protein